MRAFVAVILLAGCALAGRLENTYLPPNNAALAGGSNLATPFRSPAPVQAPQNTYLTPGSAGSSSSSGITTYQQSSSSSSGFNSGFNSGFAPSSSASYQQASQQTPRPPLIIKQISENPGDGTFTFSYETENGIQAQEEGTLRQDGAEGLQSVRGAYAFTAPDNVRYSVQYTADENGFLAYGEHLPTPPPVPEAIQKALAQNAADEARGIVDDGQYRSEQQIDLRQQQSQQQQQQQQQQQGYSYSSPAPARGNGGYRY